MLIDHVNLHTFIIIKELSQQQAYWAEQLAIFNFIIKYRKGTSNPSDSPSHQLDYEQLASIEEDSNIILPMLQKKLQESFAMSFKEPVTSILNVCKQQLATNGVEMTLLWC